MRHSLSSEKYEIHELKQVNRIGLNKIKNTRNLVNLNRAVSHIFVSWMYDNNAIHGCAFSTKCAF